MSGSMFLTGGNNGIGYFMVKQWLENGNRAAVLDLDCSNLEPLKAQYTDSLLTFVCDVTDNDGVAAAVHQTEATFGGIDIAVHNSCLCLFKSLDGHALQDYRRVMEVNFIGAGILAKAVLPGMLSRKSGKICFTSSGVGVTGFINISAYAASKGAIEAFAKCMKLEYQGSGVSFHILHPPLTDTKSSAGLPVPKEIQGFGGEGGQGVHQEDPSEEVYHRAEPG